MQPTRRYWELIGVAIALLLGAILFDRPVLVAGAGVIFGWLLAMQVAFVSVLFELDGSLTVEQSLPQRTTTIDEPVPSTLSTDGVARGLDVTVRLRPSIGLESDGPETVSLGDTLVTALRSPVAGTHALEAPEVTVTDTRGLFSEQFTRGTPRELIVRPHEPGRVHIGEGGDVIPIAFGEHTVDTGGSGLIPAELREYTGGESISRIDWKATARLTTPYVREFEAESDVTTILILDRRGRLDTGPAGETVFEYLRSSALSYLTVIESVGDPIGCFTIDDEGIEQLVAPRDSAHGYDALRRRLHATGVDTAAERRRRRTSLSHRSPVLDRETTFGRTLAAYTTAPLTASTADVLTTAIRRAATTQQGTVQIAAFTDDGDRTELRNAIAEAKRANVRLSLFIAPKVLYEPERLPGETDTTVEERYREFERFRRQLTAIDGVTAYEVAPRERIERVLEAQRLINTS